MNIKYLTTITLFMCLSVFAEAQKSRVMLYPSGDVRYDRKFLHFGFTVGLNTADFYMRNSDDFFNTAKIGEIYSIENKQRVGFLD